MKLNILDSLITGSNKINVFYLTLSLTVIISSIIGGINSYSPVPFWDMWDGYIGFNSKILHGDYGVWWEQHNEHRILLSRVLFYICFSLFNGQLWFLIVINYLLLFLIVYYLIRILNVFLSVDFIWFKFFIIALICSWTQHENLTWGFQSQFFLAYLLPLASLFHLYKAQYEKTFSLNFLLSMILGILASGSLAIGALILPFLGVYSFFMKMNWKRTILLFSTSMVVIFTYLYDYNSPGHHSSFFEVILNTPIKLSEYIVLYIGSPFFYFFGKSIMSAVIAGVSGLFFLLSVIYFTILFLRRDDFKSIYSVFLFFIYYYITNVVVTGGGRVIFGLEQAFSSRYTTPSLVAWACLFSIYLGLIIDYKLIKVKYFNYLLIFLSSFILSYQFKVLKSNQSNLFEKSVAALSLELNIHDKERISKIYPEAGAALKYSQHAVENNISVFGIFPFVDLANKIGTKIVDNIKTNGHCLGNLDKVSSIKPDNRYIFLEGWLFNKVDKTIPELFYITNETGVTVGAVLTGNPRNDIAEIIDIKAKYSGFNGYLDKIFVNNNLYFVSHDFTCILPFCISENY
jgi:hypothetical protein